MGAFMLKYFDEIIGYEEEKNEIDYICDMLNNPEKYQALGVKAPKAFLLHGDPGVGKTVIAQSIAKELGRKVFVCRKDKPDGEFVNYIKQVFEEAKAYYKENGKCIILLDDLDRYANTDRRHPNAEEYITVQTCIDEIGDRDIFVLATANSLECLPDSLLRAGRFGQQLYISKPRSNDVEAIVGHYLSKLPYVSNVDAPLIARILQGSSCAQLQEVVNQAGIFAGFEDKEAIDMDDMIKACLRYLYSDPEVFNENDNPYLIHVCYHEAAHALVSELLTPGLINIVTVCNPHPEVPAGMTNHTQEPYYFYNKKSMENRVVTLLAGKAAIEIVFGVPDVGCNNDLHRAYAIVTRFVDDYAAMGFNYWEGICSASSEALLNRKETMVASEMERFYQQAKLMLISNRDKLDRLADELFKKKVVLQPDLACILRGPN